MKLPELDKDFDHKAQEQDALKIWEENQTYAYQTDSDAEVFSVDTPPPYASAAHLHVGHAMSYTQAEFVVRFQRMLGKNIFYPMGFDDNGLPTERYVEKTYNVNKKKTTRSEFRALCLEETKRVADIYTDLWRNMGLSVDWSLKYSTIDEHCQRTSQKSFIDLYNKNRIYRSDQPVLWDPALESALAQADLETIDRKGKMWDVAFSAPDGTELVISTTRPELLGGCVGMYCHPEDERYTHLHGKTAIVPLYGHEVPIKTNEEVDKDFGTGLMMVCTFGDGEDVRKWKEDNLETRMIIAPDGKLTELAGEFAGIQAVEAKGKIAKKLQEEGFIRGEKKVDQKVNVGERSGAPAEYQMVPQWFIKVLDRKEEFLKKSADLKWFPDFMNVRLADWVNGLKYDWNISRQRFYGVPFPVWYCESCGEPHLASEDQLPVDPLEDACPHAKCSKCGHTEFQGEPDVMDTWMTSSVTPQINSNWAGTPGRTSCTFPQDVRVQGFEIIRTWLFYTLAKSDMHHDGLPWKDAMVSGWGLNEQGKKISKRDLEKYTDENGYNRYNPETVMDKFGADALRWWASQAQLGQSLRYNEKDVKAGRKVSIKLWNVARFVTMSIGELDIDAEFMPVSERSAEDRWLLSKVNTLTEEMTEMLHKYDYATAKERLEKFFWQVLCDNYLEIVKDKFWHPERYSERSVLGTKQTLWQVLRQTLSLFAPYMPFVSEAVYQRVFKDVEGQHSLHVTAWPEVRDEWRLATPEVELLLGVLEAVRQWRTEQRIGQGQELQAIVLDTSAASDEVQTQLSDLQPAIQSAARVAAVEFGQVADGTSINDVKLQIQA
jgi:valyl-tRNA synthetase